MKKKQKMNNNILKSKNFYEFIVVVVLIISFVFFIIFYLNNKNSFNLSGRSLMNNNDGFLKNEELEKYLETKNIDYDTFLNSLKYESECDGKDWGDCLESIKKVLSKFNLDIPFGICVDYLKECRPLDLDTLACKRIVNAQNTAYIIYLCI
ncbi:MAG: hypothetical protein QXS41_02250 [Candidatus Woesearchaeota archaeon]